MELNTKYRLIGHMTAKALLHCTYAFFFREIESFGQLNYNVHNSPKLNQKHYLP